MEFSQWWQLTATFSQVAAQNCRKRKIDQIKQLETEVTHNIIMVPAISCRTDHQFCEGEGHQVPQDRVSDRPREVDGSAIHMGRSRQEAPWLCPQGSTLIWHRHRWWWWKSQCLSIICRCLLLIFFLFRSLAMTPYTGNFKWTTIDKWDIVLIQQIKARVMTTHNSKTNKNKYKKDNLCTVQAHTLPK